MMILDDDASISTKPKVLIPFLDTFWSLAEEDPYLRVQGGQDLLVHCFYSSDHVNIKDTSYALRRLFDGLSSGRACARQGFASCLTSFLHIAQSNNTIDRILQELTTKEDLSSIHFCLRHLLLKCSTSANKGKTSEERDCALGRLFGISAILRSGMMKDAPSTLLEEYLDDIIHVHKFRKWTREISCQVIIEFLQAFQCNDSTWRSLIFNIVIPKFLIRLGDSNEDIVKEKDSKQEEDDVLSNWTAEQIAVALYIQRLLTPATNTEKLPSWIKQPLLSNENLACLANSLVATAHTYPRRHVVWTQILQSLLQTTQDEATKNSSSIHAVFELVVEPHLVTSTHERKALALELMHDFALALPPKEMFVAMRPKLRNLFLNTLSAPVNNKKQPHLLKPLGLKILKSLVDTACTDNNSLYSRLEIAKLLFEMDPRFDSRTKTTSTSSLLLDDSVTFQAEHLNTLIDFLEKKILALPTETNEEDMDNDDKESEKRMQIHLLDGYLELLCKTVIQMSLNLSPLEKVEIFQRILYFLMTFAFFDCRNLSLPSTNKVKKKKRNKTNEQPAMHAAVLAAIQHKTETDILLPHAFRTSMSARFFSLLADYASLFVLRSDATSSISKESLLEGEEDGSGIELSSTKLDILMRAAAGWVALEENGANLIRPELDEECTKSRNVSGEICQFVNNAFMKDNKGDGKVFSLEKRCATSMATLSTTLCLQMLRCSSDELPGEEDDLDEDVNVAIPIIWDVCQRLVQKDLRSSTDEDLTTTLHSLVEVLVDILGMKSESKSRGASVRLVRDAAKNVWSASLTLLANGASSGLDGFSLDAGKAVSILIETICGGEEAIDSAEIVDDTDGEEEEIETGEGSELFTSDVAIKAFGDSDSDSQSKDHNGEEQSEDEEEIVLGSSQLENLLLENSDVEEQGELEHYEGADSALARMIKLKQDSRKTAMRERERAVMAHQLRCISLLETLFSSKYGMLLRSDTVLFSILPLLKARRELEKSISVLADGQAPGKGGLNEKRSLLERITSVLKTKICKLKINRNHECSAVATADSIIAEAKKSPNISHCKCCSTALMFVLKFATDEESKESIGSFYRLALTEWSTKKSSKLHSVLFEDAIIRFPVFAAMSFGGGLSAAAESGRSPFIKSESFRLLSLLYDTKVDGSVLLLKSILTSSVNSVMVGLGEKDSMLTAKECRELLKATESMISFAVASVTDTNTWELLNSLSPLLNSLAGKSKSDGVQKVCTKLVSSISLELQKATAVHNQSKKKSKRKSKN